MVKDGDKPHWLPIHSFTVHIGHCSQCDQPTTDLITGLPFLDIKKCMCVWLYLQIFPPKYRSNMKYMHFRDFQYKYKNVLYTNTYLAHKIFYETTR